MRVAARPTATSCCKFTIVQFVPRCRTNSLHETGPCKQCTALRICIRAQNVNVMPSLQLSHIAGPLAILEPDLTTKATSPAAATAIDCYTLFEMTSCGAVR